MATASHSFDSILKDLSQKKYAPVYFFHGEEAFFTDELTGHIEKNVLTDGEKGFNQTVFYGKDIDARTLIAAARRFPMMSNYQVIIVKEAQNMRDLEELLPYIEKPVESTILCFAYKTKSLDKRTRLSKSLAAHVLLESKKLYENQVPGWINTYLAGKGFKIEPKACNMVAEYLGNDLSKVANELDKMIINVGAPRMLNVQDVEHNVGISREYNVFELQTAIAHKNFAKAIGIVNYFTSSKNQFGKMVVLLGSLFGYFSKVYLVHYAKDRSKAGIAAGIGVNPFFADEYLLAARNYPPARLEMIFGELKNFDLRSKGINSGSTDEGQMMKELMVKIFQ